VTAETAHEIGVKLAQELWGDRFEVVVATHCNTGHYHNHFVINSVSWADGRKFYNSPADYAKMREVSDRLCREYAISVIENPGGRGKRYAEWQAERNGKPTNRGSIRADIDRAILASTTERGFIPGNDRNGLPIQDPRQGRQTAEISGAEAARRKRILSFPQAGRRVLAGRDQGTHFAKPPKAGTIPGNGTDTAPALPPARQAPEESHRPAGAVLPLLL